MDVTRWHVKDAASTSVGCVHACSTRHGHMNTITTRNHRVSTGCSLEWLKMILMMRWVFSWGIKISFTGISVLFYTFTIFNLFYIWLFFVVAILLIIIFFLCDYFFLWKEYKYDLLFVFSPLSYCTPQAWCHG